ncbi:MAG: hypothetical protein KGQ49_06220, partial [Verrucomicrobia bacterium]|nr:hypothetical protein [Verrucomicrobiota bacterium]
PEGRTSHSFEAFGFIEKEGIERPVQIAWRLERFCDVITATQTAHTYTTYSIYDVDFNLKELHYQKGAKRIDLSRRDADGCSQITMQIAEGPNPPLISTVELPRDGRPLIQQRHLGFRPFILSDATELEFYGLIPEFPALGWILRWLDSPPFLLPGKATKKGVEEGLMKVEVLPMRGWPYNTAKTELWFDPRTGVLKKFKDSGTFLPTKEGTIVQNNRSPAPARL